MPIPSGRAAAAVPDPSSRFEDDVSRRIVEAEVHSGGWTLMHRFNLAADIIGEVLAVSGRCTQFCFSLCPWRGVCGVCVGGAHGPPLLPENTDYVVYLSSLTSTAGLFAIAFCVALKAGVFQPTFGPMRCTVSVQGHHDNPDDAMARVFVLLRYSSMRQLTWQRNYNTQPRILGAAQQRLTEVVAQVRGSHVCTPVGGGGGFSSSESPRWRC